MSLYTDHISEFCSEWWVSPLERSRSPLYDASNSETCKYERHLHSSLSYLLGFWGLMPLFEYHWWVFSLIPDFQRGVGTIWLLLYYFGGLSSILNSSKPKISVLHDFGQRVDQLDAGKAFFRRFKIWSRKNCYTGYPKFVTSHIHSLDRVSDATAQCSICMQTSIQDQCSRYQNQRIEKNQCLQLNLSPRFTFDLTHVCVCRHFLQFHTFLQIFWSLFDACKCTCNIPTLVC